MKILYAGTVWGEPARRYNNALVKAGQEAGFDIELFEITPNPPAPAYTWPELDKLWSRKRFPFFSKERKARNNLLAMKDRLFSAMEGKDVFWLNQGVNFHPDWLKEAPKETLLVFGCGDDPESSWAISAPVAPYFDYCLINNIAELKKYKAWGCEHVEWIPIFTVVGEPGISEDTFYARERDVPLVLCAERTALARRKRFRFISERFPQGFYAGHGWPHGYIEHEEMLKVYARSQIGINMHNTTGPVARRTFELPAHGIMQVCDNKEYFGRIFEDGKEGVGFESVQEAAELIEYYLHNHDERIQIAWNGYRRYWRDYHPKAIWSRAVAQFELWKSIKENKRSMV